MGEMRSAPADVVLHFVTPELRDAVARLAPLPGQERFAGRPAEALAAAAGDPGRRPVAIVADGAPAGFFVLHQGESAQPLATGDDEVLLRGFFVDAAVQRLGVASRALAGLPGFLREHLPAVRRVVLTVNLKNPTAIRVYRRAGFADTGDLYHGGAQGPQHVFTLAV
jgi:RimJ/RimL family protein N-acetyltransferase